MAVIPHPVMTYAAVRKELTRKDDIHFADYIKLSVHLSRFSSEILTAAELQIVLFIMGRSLVWKKKAENIAFRHFLEGVFNGDIMVSAPCGLSKNTIRAAIQSLNDKGFLDQHAFIDKRHEEKWRFYELNVAKILSNRGDLTASEEFSTSPEPLPEIGRPPSQKLVDINNSNINNLSSYEDSASESPTSKRVVRHRESSMAKRIEVDCNTDPRDLVKQIAGRAQATRSTRVSKNAGLVPKNKWTVVDLQALLDTAREEVESDGYRVPRLVVVAKNIGVLHRRMKEAGLQEVVPFFIWTLRNWGTVASANQRAKARQAKDTQASQSAMSLAPNFNDLAYRFPYILTLYNDREQIKENEQREARQQQAKVEQHRKQSEVAIQTRKEQARLKDLEREQQRSKDEQDIQRRVRRSPRPLANDDLVIPEYKERKWGE